MGSFDIEICKDLKRGFVPLSDFCIVDKAKRTKVHESETQRCNNAQIKRFINEFRPFVLHLYKYTYLYIFTLHEQDKNMTLKEYP